MKWNSWEKLLLFSLVRHLNGKSRACSSALIFYKKKNLKKIKMKINRSAENCLTTVFPLFLRFVQRFCADEWLHYAEICKKTPKNCRLHTHTNTHRLTYVHMLYEKAGTWAWAGAMPRCGNYFFLCENKWNLHDTWVILHVNCFFWQTTQANTQDQAGRERGVRRGESKLKWLPLLYFRCLHQCSQCQVESLAL